MESPAAGVVVEIRGKPEDEVEVGAILAIIDTGEPGQ